MRAEPLLRFLFIQYCIAAGLLLLVSPWWGVAWRELAELMPSPFLYGVVQSPWVRGAVSGFGLVHLVVGAHDLETLLGSKVEDPAQGGGSANRG